MRLVDWVRWGLDAAAFAREALGFTPDDWQEKFLRSTAKRTLLNCSRQSGKSTAAAVKALHQAICFPGSIILCLSPSQRQSSELFRKVTTFHATMKDAPKPLTDNRLTLEFETGSRIVSLPGTEGTIRGYSSVSLLIIDEASRVDDGLYRSVRPMLAVSGGQLVAMSTPFGKRGFFHDEWHGQNDWLRVEVPASACPRIDAAFLAEERASMGAWFFEQEYCCRFADAVDQLIGYEHVMAALSAEVKPLFL